jgi:hypothetical protein
VPITKLLAATHSSTQQPSPTASTNDIDQLSSVLESTSISTTSAATTATATATTAATTATATPKLFTVVLGALRVPSVRQHLESLVAVASTSTTTTSATTLQDVE